LVLVVSDEACRCGHVGGEPHPCHAKRYTCRKPARFRVYNIGTPGRFALAGMMPKLTADTTWACDECWVASAVNRREAQA
jgi:hypothetical protein